MVNALELETGLIVFRATAVEARSPRLYPGYSRSHRDRDCLRRPTLRKARARLGFAGLSSRCLFEQVIPAYSAAAIPTALASSAAAQSYANFAGKQGHSLGQSFAAVKPRSVAHETLEAYAAERALAAIESRD